MSSDWGLLGDALRKVRAHGEVRRANSVMEGMVNKVRQRPKPTRQNRIDADIRARRKARKKVEGGYIE